MPKYLITAKYVVHMSREIELSKFEYDDLQSAIDCDENIIGYFLDLDNRLHVKGFKIEDVVFEPVRVRGRMER